MRVGRWTSGRTASRPGAVFALAGILCCGVAIRLIGITQPFVDAWSWRQADVAMIADNFYRNGFSILYPQVNWGGDFRWRPPSLESEPIFF
jgi:hypothetical protein